MFVAPPRALDAPVGEGLPPTRPAVAAYMQSGSIAFTIAYPIWHALSMLDAAVCVQAIPSCALTVMTSGQQGASFAQVGAPPSPPPVEEPASSAVPPEEPLPDPLLAPLLDPPEEPLDPLDPLEEPPSLSTAGAASSPEPPKPPVLGFAAHAARSTRTLADAKTNPPIFSIDVSSSLGADVDPRSSIRLRP
jgi:hypothetical protein